MGPIPYRAVALVAWGAFACWAGLLWYLSSQPPQDLGNLSFPHIDKVAHFVYFAAGAFVLAFALKSGFGWGEGATFAGGVVVMATIGFFDEWRQTMTPGRTGGDHMDFTADVAGAMAGLALAMALYGRFRKFFA
jgi:VanZ family protein